MMNRADSSSDHRAVPVSADDIARVLTRALSDRPLRIRLTSGQRRAILHAPGTARVAQA